MALSVEQLADHVECNARQRVDPATGRLPAGRLAGMYLRMAREYEVPWQAIYLRVPADILPTEEELRAHRAAQPEPPCEGCCIAGCEDCAMLERSLGGFSVGQLRQANDHAAHVGNGLDYDATRREMWRREAERLR